jgi:propionyl-CoA carboxylase beta chain
VTEEGGRARIAALVEPGSFFELDRAESGGAVVGVGTIGGRDVALYAVDVASLDEMSAAKVVKVQELALRSRIPLVCLHDGGAGPPEGLAALAGYASVLAGHVRASGVVPQLTVAPAPAGLHPAALTDFVVDPAEVGPLLSHLPAHSGEPPPVAPADDPPLRGDPELQTMADGPYDSRELVERLLDGRAFLEVGSGCGAGLLTGLGRLAGNSTGVVASRAVAIDGEAAARAARFVRFCDAFDVPLLTVVDSPGLEAAGLDHARLLSAYGAATVPRLAVVVGRANGEAYLLLSPRQLGADLCLAWPTAAVGAGDPYPAAERGYVDEVIEPRETRRALVRGLELCLRKTAEPPPRKHPSFPF